ncbi:MAG: FtsW/RodA/SpoVE family cell cycle protein [Lachnospirales bacterium]
MVSRTSRNSSYDRDIYSSQNNNKPKATVSIGRSDYIIMLCVILLVMFGIIMVFSSSYYTSGRGDGDMYEYLKKELIFAALGFGAMFVATKFPHQSLMRFTKYVYIISCVLLVVVIFAGKEVGGAKRWIELGPITFQPSEIAKFATILSLATLLHNNPKLLDTWEGVGVYAATFLVPCGLVAVENLSTAIVIGAIACAILFVCTPRFTYFLPVAGLGVIGVAAMIFGSGFRSDRFAAWIDPFSVSGDTGYQIVQSLYSIASGGAFGLGLGGSRQKLGYMPEAHNDIIFAVICEELGWFGAAIIVTIFMVLIWRGVLVAVKHSYNYFSMLMATGITTMIAVQVIINIAVVTNSIPNTGIPLPFISYGGTSMIMQLFAMGVLMNISKYKKIS